MSRFPERPRRGSSPARPSSRSSGPPPARPDRPATGAAGTDRQAHSPFRGGPGPVATGSGGGLGVPLAELLPWVAQCVSSVLQGQSLTPALAEVPPPLRAGTQALSFHVLRRLAPAQAAMRSLVEREPPAATAGLLRVGLALLWRLDPDEALPYAEHTVVDQCVQAERAHGSLPGLVNAVLRRWLREAAWREPELRRDDPTALNLPPWWWQRLNADWPRHARALADTARRPPPMTLRVNARRGSVDDYLGRLREAGLPAEPVGPQAIRLLHPVPVERLPGFAQGAVSVQDLSAQRAAPLLLQAMAAARAASGRPADGRPRVLDACAAPGGKTAHLLELADLDLLALDSDPVRLRRVDETLGRLGLAALTRVADASRPDTWWDGRPFDAILLDAPCSGSGVVRRHPDIPWLRRPRDIPELARGQDRLIEALFPLLAPGAPLLYATCSLFREEGSARIDAFLQRHPEVQPSAPAATPGHLLGLPDNAPDASALADGFFYGLLQRPQTVPHDRRAPPFAPPARDLP